VSSFVEHASAPSLSGELKVRVVWGDPVYVIGLLIVAAAKRIIEIADANHGVSRRQHGSPRVVR
jgi:hypothetical protein